MVYFCFRDAWLPCGTTFLREFFLWRIDNFCALRELIFAIRTDWF